MKQVYIPNDALGVTDEQVQDVENIKSASKQMWTHFTPDFVDTKVQEIDLNDMVGHLNEAARLYTESRISQNNAHVRINTDLPIGIVHLGDLHFGSIYSDTDEIMRKFNVVKKTPNLYVCLMSNLIDNAIPSQYPSNMLTNGLPPDKQVIAIRKLVQELNDMGKVLGAVTSPCHEGWTWRHTGQDINALLFGFQGRRFPVLQNGGRISLKLGTQKYHGALFHQVGPFESNFNETHSLKQLHRLSLQMRMDWIAGAHRHVADAETVYEGNGKERRVVAYVRTGSEKGTNDIHDEFSVGRSGRTGEPTGQIVHLFPSKHRIQATLDFDDAVETHLAFYLYALAKKG